MFNLVHIVLAIAICASMLVCRNLALKKTLHSQKPNAEVFAHCQHRSLGVLCPVQGRSNGLKSDEAMC